MARRVVKNYIMLYKSLIKKKKKKIQDTKPLNLSQFWKCLTYSVLPVSIWKNLHVIFPVLVNLYWKGLKNKKMKIEINHNFKNSVFSGLHSEAC